MSEVNDLKAELYDLEDEFTCLKADYRLAASDEDIIVIKRRIDQICADIVIVRRVIAKFERGQNV